jgi:hypothetical protein
MTTEKSVRPLRATSRGLLEITGYENPGDNTTEEYRRIKKRRLEASSRPRHQ